jgi:hypothetical protein
MCVSGHTGITTGVLNLATKLRWVPISRPGRCSPTEWTPVYMYHEPGLAPELVWTHWRPEIISDLWKLWTVTLRVSPNSHNCELAHTQTPYSQIWTHTKSYVCKPAARMSLLLFSYKHRQHYLLSVSDKSRQTSKGTDAPSIISNTPSQLQFKTPMCVSVCVRERV